MQCAARWCHVDAIRAFPPSRWRWDIASSWRETFFARLQTNEYKWNRILLCIYCTVLQQFFSHNPDPIRSDPLDDVLNVRKNHRLTSLHQAVSLNIFIHYKSSSIKATFEGETISGNKLFFSTISIFSFVDSYRAQRRRVRRARKHGDDVCWLEYKQTEHLTENTIIRGKLSCDKNHQLICSGCQQAATLRWRGKVENVEKKNSSART